MAVSANAVVQLLCISYGFTIRPAGVKPEPHESTLVQHTEGVVERGVIKVIGPCDGYGALKRKFTLGIVKCKS